MALGQLSDDVKATMNEVKGSINEALKIQKNASIEFTLSSQALNDSIAATTGTWLISLVNQLKLALLQYPLQIEKQWARLKNGSGFCQA